MGFPVHAGIDPDLWTPDQRREWFPRTRGDRPMMRLLVEVMVLVSPYTRG